MLLAVALAKFCKGSRGHFLKLINPLSVRKHLVSQQIYEGLRISPTGKFVGYLKSGKGESRLLVMYTKRSGCNKNLLTYKDPYRIFIEIQTPHLQARHEYI